MEGQYVQCPSRCASGSRLYEIILFANVRLSCKKRYTQRRSVSPHARAKAQRPGRSTGTILVTVVHSDRPPTAIMVHPYSLLDLRFNDRAVRQLAHDIVRAEGIARLGVHVKEPDLCARERTAHSVAA